MNQGLKEIVLPNYKALVDKNRSKAEEKAVERRAELESFERQERQQALADAVEPIDDQIRSRPICAG